MSASKARSQVLRDPQFAHRLTTGVQAILGSNGLASQHYGLAHKPQQLAYALQWCKALVAGQADADHRTALLLLSADTGLGKTLGYAVPLLLYCALTGQRALIATKSLGLQRQMSEPGGDLDKALDLVSLHSARPRLRLALRPGQQAYLSASNIARLLDVLQEEPGADLARSGLIELLDYAQDEGKSGLFEDAVNDLYAGVAPAWMVRAQLTLNAASDPTDLHKYLDANTVADKADVVLIAQHLLACSALYGADVIGAEPFGALVVDEADQLGEVAREQGMTSLSLSHLSGALVRSPPTTHEASIAIRRIGTKNDNTMVMMSCLGVLIKASWLMVRVFVCGSSAGGGLKHCTGEVGNPRL